MTYTYDAQNNLGYLAQVTNGAATTNYTGYDGLGNILTSNQVTSGQTYNFSYTYNLTGALTGETYPSGRQVAIGLDELNRVTCISSGSTSANCPAPYVSNVQYAPQGAPSQFSRGNNLWRQIAYNKPIQVSGYAEQINNQEGQDLLMVALSWRDGNNNGTLNSATYNHGGPGYQQFLTFQQSYSYL